MLRQAQHEELGESWLPSDDFILSLSKDDAAAPAAGSLAGHVAVLELALDVAGQLAQLVLVAADIGVADQEGAGINEMRGLRWLDPRRIGLHRALSAGQQVERVGADIGLAIGVLRHGAGDEAVLDG